MIASWDRVETILSLNYTPSSTPRFPVRALITPGVLHRVIIDNYHWIKIKVENTKKNTKEVISRDYLNTNRVRMFYRC